MPIARTAHSFASGGRYKPTAKGAPSKRCCVITRQLPPHHLQRSGAQYQGSAIRVTIDGTMQALRSAL